MAQPIVRIHHLLSDEASGVVTERVFEEASRLTGFYLDYALACVRNFQVISLFFSAGPRPDYIEVEERQKKMVRWSPMQDEALARALVTEHLGSDAPATQEQLIEVVRLKIGNQVELFRVVADTR